MDQQSSLAKRTLDLCRKLKLSLACAESMTGGEFAASLTKIPGASEFFRGGIIAYTNGLKRDLLSVPEELLQKGSVSEEVAIAMARGIKDLADIAISVTGNAGPTGEPLGTYFACILFKEKVHTWQGQVDAPREIVIKSCVSDMLSTLCTFLESDNGL